MRNKKRALLGVVAASVAGGAILLSSYLSSGFAPPFGSAIKVQEDNRKINVGLLGRGELNTLDPARAATEAPISVVWNVYDRLLQMNERNDLVPMLAESWESSDDMTRWTFNIRPNVRFHDQGWGGGRTLDSADVKYSIERAVRIPGYSRSLVDDVLVGVDDFLAGKSNAISGITADGNKVIFVLKRPFAFLPDRLATSYMSIVPTGAPDEGQLPAGTGAFEVEEWDAISERATLRRWDHYWGTVSPQAPARLGIRAVKNEALAAAELAAGGLDWLELNASAIDALRSSNDRKIRIASFAHTELRLAAVNVTTAPFDSSSGPALQLALNLGIDREAIVRRLGGGGPFAGPVPLSEFSDLQLSYDQARARDLANSLPPEAKKLTMLVEPVDEARFIAELLVAQWRAIGLDVAAVPGRADFFERAVARDYQLALAYYGPFVPSAEQYLWMYRAAAIPVPNVMGYRDPQFEQAFARYVAATDPVQRRAAVRSAISELLRAPPAIWIVQPPRFVATTTDYRVERSGGLPNYRTLSTLN